MAAIDINCDMGEGFGIYRLGDDGEAMQYVSSVNLACGFHASDPLTMKRTVAMAREKGVAVGAHPSFPDLAGFGRRNMAALPEEIEADVIYQIGALTAFCRSEGLVLQHVKPHGALCNQAAVCRETADAVARAIRSVDSSLWMVCQAGTVMVDAAREAGLPYVQEAYADRAYTAKGTLVPRKEAGSVITDCREVVQRVLSLIEKKCIHAADGQWLSMDVQTICVHSDTAGAIDMVRSIHGALDERGIRIMPFGRRDP